MQTARASFLLKRCATSLRNPSVWATFSLFLDTGVIMPTPDIRGVTVATVLPFNPDLTIDWDSYSRVLDHCACPDGIAAVFVNGHAGEGALLTEDEQLQVIARTRAHVGSKPVLAGIITQSTTEAVRQSANARDAGADCAVLFPPAALGSGAAAIPRAPVAYVRAVAEATGMAVSVFQYPVASGFGYSSATLAEIAAIPGVIAIKEGSDTIMAYEDNWRAVRAGGSGCLILPSNYNWFLPQLAIGADGILSGLVSLVPGLFVDLWRATVAQDLGEMRAAYDRLQPIVRSIYGNPPLIDMHTRIKVALEHMGIIAHAAPRPPLLPVLAEVKAAVVSATDEARKTGRVQVA